MLCFYRIRATPHCPRVLRWSSCRGHSWWAHAATSLPSFLLCLFVFMFLSTDEGIQERGSGAVSIEYGRKQGTETYPHWIYLLILFLDMLITIVGKILRPGEQPWDYHTTLVSAGCSFIPIPVTSSSFHQINYQIVGDSTDFKRKWLTSSSGDVFYY